MQQDTNVKENTEPLTIQQKLSAHLIQKAAVERIHPQMRLKVEVMDGKPTSSVSAASSSVSNTPAITVSQDAEAGLQEYFGYVRS